MKRLLIPIILLTFCTVSFGQKAKIKKNNFVYNYEVYPEIAEYENVKTFSIKVIDKNDVSFSYSEGNTSAAMAADIHNHLGLAYGFKQFLKNYELLFEIKQNSSVENEKVLLNYQDPTTKAKKYSYEISAKQNYTVKIFDVKKGDSLLKEFTFDVNTKTSWPGNPSATVGYGSVKLLADNFTKKQETEEGFYKKIDSRLISRVLNTKIRKEIILVLHKSKEKFIYLVSNVKTKDTKFTRLDSATIYLDQGLAEIKLNNKSAKKGNHHIENAKSQFLKAHAIYIEYSKEEYLDWFTDSELKEEYFSNMTSNLYLTSFLTSDFYNANRLYIELKTRIGANKVDDSSLSGTIGSLKRTSAQKAIDNMNVVRSYQVREENIQEIFKERYGY